MAIYHLSMKIISRGTGQNAVASAAYRSGEKLTDNFSNEVKYYSRSVSPETHILAPSNSPDWVFNRQKLWNTVEKVEKRVDSRLARELEIALPLELNDKEQTSLIKEFVQKNCVDKGMVADISIHRDHPENPHAHIMLTTRNIDKSGFLEKNTDWNKVQYLEQIRKQWATLTNEHLERAGSLEKIDHRSYKDQGIELLPTKHIGVSAMAMERKGVPTEKGNLNRQIEAYNKKIVSLNEKREELIAAGATQKTDFVKHENNLVVTYSNYMTNQRSLRLSFNVKNQYTKLQKQRALKPFEEKMLEAANNDIARFTKIKFDFLGSVNSFLNGKNSIFIQFARDYGYNMSSKLREEFEKNNPGKTLDEKHWERTAKRYSDELVVRISTKIQTIQSSDFNTVVLAVEKDFHFDKVKSLLKGWTNYPTLVKKIIEIQDKLKELPAKTSDTQTVNKKEIQYHTELASLKYVKEFQEAQAISELKRRGFTELISKYDNPDYQIVLVKAYEELSKNGLKSIDEMTLDSRVMNNFKLEHAQNLVRGKLTGLNIQKRKDSYDKWYQSLIRQQKTLASVNVSLLPEDKRLLHEAALKENQENLATLRSNAKSLVEAEKILTARTDSFLKGNKEIKEVFDSIQLSPLQELRDPMSKDFKLAANIGLFADNDKLTNQQIVSEMYDNILAHKEYTTERDSKSVLRRNEYDSYKATIGNLDNYKRQAEEMELTIDKTKDRMHELKDSIQKIEAKWTEREDLKQNTHRFSSRAHKDQIKDLDDWFDKREITARTLVGATKQTKFQFNQVVREIETYKNLTEAKIPALENMKLIHENKAIRDVEKSFELDPSFQYRVKLSDAEKEQFINYSELKRSLGTEHLAVEQLEKKIEANTEKYKQAEKQELSLETLIKEKQGLQQSLNNLIDVNIEKLSTDLYSKEGIELKETKEELDELGRYKKTENDKYNEQINKLQKEQDLANKNKGQYSKTLAVTGKFGKALESLETKVSQGQADREHQRRKKSLEKEQGLTLRLEK